MRLYEVGPMFRELAARAGEAVIPAADKMASDFRDEVKRRLTEKSHARGTRTPAPEGGPPAMESGVLAGSVTMDPASTPVVATASVAPHLPPRDWVQEWGIPDGIHVARARYMHFWYDTERFEKWVPAPERSYMRSTVDLMIASGQLTQAAAEAFYAAMWG